MKANEDGKVYDDINITSRWTGFFTPSETFQNTDRYSKPYGTGSKPVPAFDIAHTVAIEQGQTS